MVRNVTLPTVTLLRQRRNINKNRCLSGRGYVTVAPTSKRDLSLFFVGRNAA
jgi:hypothetical protein